jgi:ribosome-associated translation inhibitor RaiA
MRVPLRRVVDPDQGRRAAAAYDDKKRANASCLRNTPRQTHPDNRGADMQMPLKITFCQMPHSEALEARIRSKAAKLEAHNPNTTGCTVTIEEQRLHQQQGRWFNVRVVVRVPDREVVVNRDHDEDPNVALREAFDAVTRRLEHPRRATLRRR